MSNTISPSKGGSGRLWSAHTRSTRFFSAYTNDSPAADRLCARNNEQKLNNWVVFIKKKLATPLKKILTLQKPSGDVAQLRSWLRRQEQANHHLQPPSPAHSAIVSSVLGLNSQPPGHPWLISPPPGWLNGLRWPRQMNNKQQAIIDTFSTIPCLKTKRHHAYIMHALLLCNGRKSFHEAHLRHFGPFS